MPSRQPAAPQQIGHQPPSRSRLSRIHATELRQAPKENASCHAPQLRGPRGRPRGLPHPCRFAASPFRGPTYELRQDRNPPAWPDRASGSTERSATRGQWEVVRRVEWGQGAKLRLQCLQLASTTSTPGPFSTTSTNFNRFYLIFAHQPLPTLWVSMSRCMLLVFEMDTNFIQTCAGTVTTGMTTLRP
jgi:hypothetical protein